MPRPKKVGAPEPKKRSRNGCWPCKTRKVKCDENRPTCQNCQRQGEICDYSIRLNWEGRGKKKDGSAVTGQINFSAGMISGSGRPDTADSAPTPSSQAGFHPVMAFDSPITYQDGLPRISEFNQQTALHTTQPLELTTPQSVATDNSMIDPALIDAVNSPAFDDIYREARPEHQYTQSYERYRSLTPGTSFPAQSSTLPRLLQVQRLEGSTNSPTNSDTRSPTFPGHAGHLTTESPASTPPFFGNSKDNNDVSLQGELEPPAKRARYIQAGREVTSPSYDATMPPPNMTPYSSYNPESQTSSVIIAAPCSTSTPLTPASSHSDDYHRFSSSKTSQHADSPDNLRRLSVSSLLSGPPGMPYQSDRSSGESNRSVQDWSLQLNDPYQDTTAYGVDRGFKDLDIGKNDDANAISGSSPITVREHLNLTLENGGELSPVEFGFGTENDPGFENGGYYNKPVAICIPKILEPLPSKLLENPMNLLYFHHFLNHTAGCLIPHNCSSNPFKSILPQMAVRDDNLMNLLLAYSASHRARHLGQPEPATRIALWVQDIFPNLRRALNEPNEIITDANLATTIMLASLEIISPKSFGVEVPWQNHLDTARQMIAARGGPQRMQTASRGDKVSSFLWSWFAYLDVLGSLSGGKVNSSSSAWILDYETDAENEFSIDCILGFTSRCVHILAKIAELSRICDGSRIGPDHAIRADWKPSEDVVARAQKLELDLVTSRLHPARPCTHMQSSGEAAYQWDSLEMAATNEAFHWAGLVHLHRRIFGKPSYHEDVQTAVREIFGALYKVRRGSSAEACLLFPMFTAGCDTEDERQRADILERIKCVERTGMTQVRKARKLMERVWETGKPWETLVAGEFFG